MMARCLTSVPGHRELPVYRHAFTHFDLALHPLLIDASPPDTVHDDARLMWYDPAHPVRIGLAKPAVDLIEAVRSRSGSQALLFSPEPG